MRSTRQEEYNSQGDWELDKAHVRNTSEAVRTLVRAIVDTGAVDEYAMRTVYNLCQNDNALTPEKKKERIERIEINEDAKDKIKQCISDGTGIVGKGRYTVPIEGFEQEAYEFLRKVIESDGKETIDEAIKEFASLDIDGIQAGIISVILYFIHPKKYPISNKRSRTAMEKYFNYNISSRLHQYVEDTDKFREVRDRYPFKNDFRHLDNFFNWVEQQDVNDAKFYWVNQNREVEFKDEFLRSQDTKWQRDLTVLETGDIIFHYIDQAIRAFSVVTTEARRTDMEGGEYYRVDVDTTQLAEPLPLEKIREGLQNPYVFTPRTQQRAQPELVKSSRCFERSA